MKSFRLKPKGTILCKMLNGDTVRVVSADSYTQKVKVIRCKDGLPFTTLASLIGLNLPPA